MNSPSDARGPAGQEPPLRRPDAWLPSGVPPPLAPPSPVRQPVPPQDPPARAPIPPGAAGPAERSPRLIIALVAAAVAVTLIAVLALPALILGDRPTPTRLLPAGTTSPRASLPARTPSASPTLQGGTGALAWIRAARDLRPDLAEARFSLGHDGSSEAGHLLDTGPVLVALTSAGNGYDDMVVHGLDAGTGVERWRLDRDQPLCAGRLLRGALVCASVTHRDAATQLGVRWTVELIDPATGRITATAPFAGWLTLILVADDRIVLLEQRRPAPHAVVSGWEADLRPAWSLDLAGEPGHDGLFSENRIVVRDFPPTIGPALDRPRIRTVAGGLTALWIGRTAIFLDVAQGRSAGMPTCSRLVDDGARLWCNTGDRATALTYGLTPTHRTEPGVRLAFPKRDPRGGDITVPVFLDADGAAIRVDRATGATLGPLMPSGFGEAFGVRTEPSSFFVGGLTLFQMGDHVVAHDPAADVILWDVPLPHLEGAYARGEQILLARHDRVVLVDAASGRVWYDVELDAGRFDRAGMVGEALIVSSGEQIGRLIGP